MYNASELVLHWEPRSPITVAPELHLTEYVLVRKWTNESIINADLSDLRHGAFAGNYSSLSFNLHLAREMGFYMMDYFIPSIMIVAISWVNLGFSLQRKQNLKQNHFRSPFGSKQTQLRLESCWARAQC